MKRPLKIVIICLTVAAIVIGALVAAVLLLPETDLLRDNVQRQLEALTGQKVLLGAMEVSFSFPSLAHLTLEGISIQTREGRQLFSADKVVLSPETAPLLRGELAVRSVQIRGFRTFVERSRDGVVQSPFVVIPASSEGMRLTSDGTPQGAPDAQPKGDQSKAAPPKEQPAKEVKWSINRIVLQDGTIEWIDNHVIPGKRVEIPLWKISGTLTQAKQQRAVEIALKALLGKGEDGGSPLEVKGTVVPTPDYSGVEKASVSLSSPCLRTGYVRPYVPPAAEPLNALSCGDVNLRLEMTKGRRPLISIKAGLKTKPQQADRIRVEADLIAGEGFASIEEARFKTETDSLPLESIAHVIPSGFPLDPKVGTIKGSATGEWKGRRDWRLKGSAAVEGAQPVGMFKAIAKRVRVWGQGTVEPDTLTVENLEVSDSAKLAGVSGKIAGLSSGNTSVDLKVDLIGNSAWARAFGLHMPEKLQIGGTLPIRGRIRGKPDNLWVDLVANVSRASISWSPYVEKPAGGKGSVSIKGTLLPAGTKNAKGPLINADTAVNIAGTRLRVLPEGLWLSNAVVNFSSKLSFKNGEAHLRKSTLGVRRGSEAKEVLLARSDIFHLGSPKVKMKGNATLVLDRETLSIAGIPKTRELNITGSSALDITFAGSPSSFEWSAGLPLTALDIRKEKAFQKPGGVRGSLAASGETHAKAVTIKSASLKLAGFTVLAKGEVTDSTGAFKELAVEVKKSDLKSIANYFPELAKLRPSGPVTAAFDIKKAGSEVRPTGTVDLVGVDLRPAKGDWKLGNVKAILSIKGQTAELKEFKGDLESFVQGPIQAKGVLSPVGPVENLNGKLSISIGKGKVQGKGFLKALAQAGPLLQAVMGEDPDSDRGGLLGFDYIGADFKLDSGIARTDNLQLSGARLKAGAIGKIALASSRVDMLTMAHVVIHGTDAVGKIPAVKKFIKQHEGILRATGLDKELSRFGIKIPDSKEQAPQSDKPSAVPVTLITSIRGSMGSPKVTPVLETTLDQDTLARLKGLIHNSK